MKLKSNSAILVSENVDLSFGDIVYFASDFEIDGHAVYATALRFGGFPLSGDEPRYGWKSEWAGNSPI